MVARPSIQPGVLAVNTLRKEAVKQAQAELARTREVLSEAEADVVAARAAVARGREPARPTGRMSGAALQRAGTYLQRLEDEQADRQRELSRREATLMGARKRVERAREALRAAHVEAQLVERHVARREQEQRRQLERRADDEADEGRRLGS